MFKHVFEPPVLDESMIEAMEADESEEVVVSEAIVNEAVAETTLLDPRDTSTITLDEDEDVVGRIPRIRQAYGDPEALGISPSQLSDMIPEEVTRMQRWHIEKDTDDFLHKRQ